MSILVTGGSGVLGTQIIRRLVGLGEKPVCFQRREPKADYFPKEMKATQGDVRHIEDIIACIKENHVTKIIHLAYSISTECEAHPHSATQINILGTNNIFEAARLCGIKRVVFASSLAYYGPQSNFGDIKVVEESFGRPGLVYGAHKQLCEYMAQKYANQYGLSIGIVRMSHIHCHFTGRKEGGVGGWLRGSFASDPVMGKPVHLDWKPATKLCVIYGDDAAELFVKVCQAENLKHLAYNAGGHTCSLDELVSIVKDFIPGAQFSFGEPIDPKVTYMLSDERASKEFGFKRRDLRQGILDHINEARKDANLPPICSESNKKSG